MTSSPLVFISTPPYDQRREERLRVARRRIKASCPCPCPCPDVTHALHLRDVHRDVTRDVHRDIARTSDGRSRLRPPPSLPLGVAQPLREVGGEALPYPVNHDLP